MKHEAGSGSGALWSGVDDDVAARRCRSLLSAVEEGVFDVGADGTFLDVDDDFVAATGHDRSDLLGSHVSTVLRDDDADRLERELRDATADVVTLDVTVLTAGGADLPGELRAVPTGGDREGGAVGTLRTVDDGPEDVSAGPVPDGRYRRIFENSEEPIFVVDPHADEILEANAAGCALLGYGREELLSLGPSDCHAGEMDRFREFLDGVYEDGSGATDELACRTKDGRRVPVALSASTVEFDGRECLLAVVRDVSDYEERADRRDETERRYRTLAENFPNGVVTLYDHDLEYTLAAGRGFEKLSVDPADVEGSGLRESWGEAAAETLEPVLRAALDGEEQSVELEYEDREWLLRAVPIADDDGDVYAGATMAVDVTERQDAERQLRRREQQLSRLTSNIPGMVYRCGNAREWPMEFVSEGARELTGYDPEAFESGAVSYGEDVVVEGDRDRVWDEVQSALDEREPFSVTYEVETADGERRWVADYGRGVRDEDGDVVGAEGVIIDVTERERIAERLAESERRYRTLVDHFPNGAVALFDENLEYVVAGGSAFDDIEDGGEDLVGTTVRERYPGELAEKMEAKFEAALEGEASTFELEFHGRNWIAHTLPIHDEEAEHSDGMIMVQEVTEQKQRERALERSRRQYQTLVDHFPNGAVALVDEDLEYRTIGGTTPTGVDATGADLEGEDLRESLPEELADRLASAYEGAFDGESNSFEHRLGEEVYQFHTVPVRDEDGDVFAAMGMSQDITEQKDQQRALQDAKAQLEAATEAADVGTWEWHVQDDQFVAGASLAKLFGVDPEDAREGVSIDRLISSIYEPDRERVEAEIESAVDSCGEYEAEYRVWNAEGDLRWVFARGHVECDEDGTARSFPGALTDITDRKRAEQELQRHKEQLETLFEVLPVGVVVADADGSIVEANDTAREIWGGDVFDADSVAEYEMYPVRWADSGEPVTPEEMTLARVVDGEEVTETDVFEIDAFDDERRIIRLEGRPIRDASGEVIRGVVTLTDITERRQYQKQLEESNERLEQFAYAASHDLQEPLRMVTSYLQLLERRYGDELDDDAEEFIEFAVDGAERMRGMIEALLEYSRVETRGDPFEPVDLEEALDDVIRDVRVRMEETGAEVTSGTLPTVEGDPDQLRQVLQNLLSNAIEYSGDEPPEVHVDAERDGDRWRVSVADDGIGIPPDQQERVFEVFQRLHSREEHDGTGIGLALCRRIVERHDGDVRVESTPGEGSTFYFTLPVEVERDG